jgi:hypothetical protein
LRRILACSPGTGNRPSGTGLSSRERPHQGSDPRRDRSDSGALGLRQLLTRLGFDRSRRSRGSFELEFGRGPFALPQASGSFGLGCADDPGSGAGKVADRLEHSTRRHVSAHSGRSAPCADSPRHAHHGRQCPRAARRQHWTWRDSLLAGGNWQVGERRAADRCARKPSF